MNYTCLRAFLPAIICFIFSGIQAQNDCGWQPDVESDYMIGVSDVLGVLSVFGQFDSDMDGVWDGSDVCIDTDACNYDANPSVACEYLDALGVCGGNNAYPELLLGTWRLTSEAGAVGVGPTAYSTEWFTSEAFGLQAAQYDDFYTFQEDGTLTTDYNGSIINSFADYAEQGYGCGSTTYTFLPSGGTSGEDAFQLGTGTGGCACPFMGVTDAGLVYDIVSLTSTTLILHAQGDDANCDPAALYFTLTFTRVIDPNEEVGGDVCVAPESYPGMTLVWEEEFNGSTINPSNWTYDLGASGWGNNEWQNYTNSPLNSSVADGFLTITARQTSDGYTSARMKTSGLQEFQYGRIDVRAKLPQGQGIWPAIWMLGANIDAVGWPACGEIDIMELVGHQPQTTHGTAHWGSSFSVHQYDGSSISLPAGQTFSDAFHLFSIDWQPNSITWMMDNVPFYSINSGQMNGQPYPFNAPFFFILNIAVGGNWPGYPDGTTTFPQEMVIDCIRVFQEG